jgi:hypothetical protein
LSSGFEGCESCESKNKWTGRLAGLVVDIQKKHKKTTTPTTKPNIGKTGAQLRQGFWRIDGPVLPSGETTDDAFLFEKKFQKD